MAAYAQKGEPDGETIDYDEEDLESYHAVDEPREKLFGENGVLFY